MAEELGNVKAVRTFLDQGSSHPVTTPELMLFWKLLTEEEKLEFGNDARKLLAA